MNDIMPEFPTKSYALKIPIIIMPKFSTKISAEKISIITMPKFPTKYYAVKSNFPGCGFITSHPSHHPGAHLFL